MKNFLVSAATATRVQVAHTKWECLTIDLGLRTSRCLAVRSHITVRWLVRLAALLSLLLAGMHAQATAYSFSLVGQLPSSCSRNSLSTTSYTCGVVTLEAGDTITVGLLTPVTITFTGAFTTVNGNLINAQGAASDLNLVTNGVLTLGANTVLNANVAGTAAINIGAGSTIGGHLTASSVTGVVTLAANSTVGGFVQTDEGAINVGDASTVGSNITSTGAGVVTLGTNVKVGGSIETSAGALTVGDASTVGGHVTSSGAGVVTLGADIKVAGRISSTAGAITIGNASTTGGSVITTGAGVVTLTTNIKIGGNIESGAGAINIGDNSTACGSVIVTGAGVVTLTTNVKIGGNISSGAGAITVGGGGTVGGDVFPTGAGVVTLTGVLVGGKVQTSAGAITLTDTRVRGTVTATGAGVVTTTNSVANDLTLVVPPACSAPGTTGLDHIRVSHDGSGLTCIPSTVTVTACANASCTAPHYTGGVSIALNPGGQTFAVNATGINTVATVAQTMAGSVNLTVASATPTANFATTCLNTRTADANCAMAFADAGFIFSAVADGAEVTIPSQTAGMNSGPYFLRAVKKSTTTQACVGSLSGPQTVQFAYECNDPTTCAAPGFMQVNAAAIARNNNTGGFFGNYDYTGVNLIFDINGNAPFVFTYGDVGKVTLYAKKAPVGTQPLLAGNTNAPFVVKPFDFLVVPCTGSSACTTAPADPGITGAGGVFIKSGNPFNATITARAFGGTTTPSFGLGTENGMERVAIMHALQGPAGGSAGALSGTLSVTRSSFNNGVASVSDLKWSEVGVITLSATNSIFFGNSLTTVGSSGRIGRFIPDHFLVTPGSVVNRLASPRTPPSVFSYAGEELQLKDFRLTAVNGLVMPTTTRNYTGGFARFDGGVVGNFGFSAVDLADAIEPLVASAFTNGTGAGMFSLVSSSGNWSTGVGTFIATVKLNRASVPAGPYESFRIGVEPLDTDEVGVLPSAKNLSTSVPAGANNKVLIGSTLVRFGRIRLQNAYGSERLALPVPVQAQYWKSSGWGRNNEDSSTAMRVPEIVTLTSPVVLPGVASLYFYPVTIKNKLVSSDTVPTIAAALMNGAGVLNFTAPTKSGWLDIILDVPDYLKFNWGNCVGQPSSAGLLNDRPCARAIFGIYKSPIIYRRENY